MSDNAFFSLSQFTGIYNYELSMHSFIEHVCHQNSAKVYSNIRNEKIKRTKTTCSILPVQLILIYIIKANIQV